MRLQPVAVVDQQAGSKRDLKHEKIVRSRSGRRAFISLINKEAVFLISNKRDPWHDLIIRSILQIDPVKYCRYSLSKHFLEIVSESVIDIDDGGLYGARAGCSERCAVQ